MKKVYNVGVVGCGSISGIFMENMMNRYDNLRVVSCCAKHFESAQRQADKYGVQPTTFEEMIQDPTIDIIVVLTPVPTHYELIKASLNAGKHVYSEKVLTMTSPESEELCAIAKAKNLKLGCAPDTIFGQSLQTTKKALEEHIIGDVTSFSINVNRNYDIISSYLPFTRLPGGDIVRDYSVYHLTALTYLFGDVKSIFGVTNNPKPIRKCIIPFKEDFNQEFEFPNDTQVDSILTLKNGLRGTLHMDGESIIGDLCAFYIYGSKGILKVSDVNYFSGNLVHYFLDPKTRKLTEEILDYGIEKILNERGKGVADLACSIEENREPLSSSERATHVLKVMEALFESSKNGTFVEVK